MAFTRKRTTSGRSDSSLRQVALIAELLAEMLVIAAYDRRPFTGAAGGFEVMWGIRHGAQSIPLALKALSLFTPEEVQRLDQDTVHHWLDSQRYFALSLGDGSQ